MPAPGTAISLALYASCLWLCLPQALPSRLPSPILTRPAASAASSTTADEVLGGIGPQKLEVHAKMVADIEGMHIRVPLPMVCWLKVHGQE